MLIKSVCTSVHEVLTTKVCCMQKIFTYSIMESITVWPTFCLIGLDWVFFQKNRPTPASFSFIFGLIKQTLQFLQQISMWKKCPSSIRCRDLNPRPLGCESFPITTRPGLPPRFGFSCFVYIKLRSDVLVWLSPNMWNRRYAVQWY